MNAEAIQHRWVCFAVREEMRPFARRVAGRGGLRLLLTGMGAANASRTLEVALASATALPDLVLSSGFAGGLNPALACGQVVFAVPSGDPLEPRLIEAGAVAGRFHQSDRVAITREEKQRLRRQTGADAVEMESTAIREVCGRHDIRCVVVRVISDAADETLPLDFNVLMTPDHRMDFVRLAGQILRRPGLIRELLAFQRRTREAAERLAEGLASLKAG